MVGAGGVVHAFEPFDANADLLERSIRENRFERPRRLPASRGRRSHRHGDADVPGRDAEYWRRVPASRRHAAATGQPDEDRARRRARRRDDPAAGPVHQDGRRRRRAAGDAGRGEAAARGSADRAVGASSRRSSIARRAARATAFCPPCAPPATARTCSSTDEVGAPLDHAPRRRARLDRPPSDVGFCKPPRPCGTCVSARQLSAIIRRPAPSSTPSPRAR